MEALTRHHEPSQGAWRHEDELMHFEPALEAEPHPVQEESRYVPDVLSPHEQRARLLSGEERAVMDWQERMSNGAGISPPPGAAAAGVGGGVPPWWVPGGLPWGPGGWADAHLGQSAIGAAQAGTGFWKPEDWELSWRPWWMEPGPPFGARAGKRRRLKRAMDRLWKIRNKFRMQLQRVWPGEELHVSVIPGGGGGRSRVHVRATLMKEAAEHHFREGVKLFWGNDEPSDEEIENLEDAATDLEAEYKALGA